MADPPLVSVIITAFNRADTIGRAIDSVMAQTMTDFEIIVVDDASSDGTSEFVEGLGNPSIRLVRNAVNRGIGGAKNVGVDAARAKYIAFLDSDDEWLENKLAHQLVALRTVEARCPLSFTAFWLTRTGDDKTVLRCPRKYGTWLNSILMGEAFSLGATLLMTREAFNAVGPFDETMTRLQDRDWTLRYFDHYHDFLFLDEPLAKINNSGWPDAATVERATRQLFEVSRARLARWDRSYVDLFYASLKFETAAIHYRNGELLGALRNLAAAAWRKPSFLTYIGRRVVRKFIQGDFA